ncbi:unnamed protein product [Rotaria magnacalcarata]
MSANRHQLLKCECVRYIGEITERIQFFTSSSIYYNIKLKSVISFQNEKKLSNLDRLYRNINIFRILYSYRTIYLQSDKNFHQNSNISVDN